MAHFSIEVQTFPDIGERVPEKSVILGIVDGTDEYRIALIDQVHGDPGEGLAGPFVTVISEITVDQFDIADKCIDDSDR